MQSAAMTAADVHRTILAVWRIEQPRLITGLSRMLRDVTLAEDLTQEFIYRFLERDSLSHLSPAAGRFRSFLLVCLKHFLANERERAHAADRLYGAAGAHTLLELRERPRPARAVADGIERAGNRKQNARRHDMRRIEAGRREPSVKGSALPASTSSLRSMRCHSTSVQ